MSPYYLDPIMVPLRGGGKINYREPLYHKMVQHDNYSSPLERYDAYRMGDRHFAAENKTTPKMRRKLKADRQRAIRLFGGNYPCP